MTAKQQDHTLQEMGQRLRLLEEILDVPESAAACMGRVCTECTDTFCPLRENRIAQIGSLLTTLLREFQWHHAFMEEMEGTLSPRTQQRVQLRVQIQQWQEALNHARQNQEALAFNLTIRDQIQKRVQQLELDIRNAQEELARA